MTKKRGIFSKLFFSVVMLTLISCCFLGSTFARYTSGRSGTATIQVAKWDVKNTTETTTATFSKLSPSMEDYYTTNGDYAAGTPRTHSTGKVLVATIENKGDVDALVTFTFGTETLTCGAAYGQGVATDGIPTQDEVKEVFDIKLWYGKEKGEANATKEMTSGETEVNVPATDGVIYVYAEVIWTSDIGEITGTTADKRDTWIGQYVESVTYTISYTAVQNTELPKA